MLSKGKLTLELVFENIYKSMHSHFSQTHGSGTLKHVTFHIKICL